MAGTHTVNSLVLGDSATNTNNFQLRTNTNGTATLARGAAGNLGDVFTVDAANKLTLASTPNVTAPNTISTIRVLSTGIANGSTNTMIARLNATPELTQGSDVTYADSATLGALFTINSSGFYAISFTAGTNGTFGVSLNASGAQLTATIQSITATNRLGCATASSAGLSCCTSWLGYLPSGSLIRPHCDVTSSTTATSSFTITRVS